MEQNLESKQLLKDNVVTDHDLEKTRKMIYNGYTWDKVGNDLNDIICSLEK